MKATDSRNTLDELSARLQTALREKGSLVDNVRQLEIDKTALEERVTQLVGEETSRGTELEESKQEVCRLRKAVEEHMDAAKQVTLMCWSPVRFFSMKSSNQIKSLRVSVLRNPVLFADY